MTAHSAKTLSQGNMGSLVLFEAGCGFQCHNPEKFCGYAADIFGYPMDVSRRPMDVGGCLLDIRNIQVTDLEICTKIGPGKTSIRHPMAIGGRPMDVRHIRIRIAQNPDLGETFTRP